jgi:HAD superfamily hydrolase (TIGR01490 family)
VKVPMSRDVSADLFQLPALDAKIIFFDVDHTITCKATGVRWIQVGLSAKSVSWFNVIRLPFYLFRYKFGNLNFENLPTKFDPLAGIPKATLEQWGRDTFVQHIETDIYPAALALIRRLRQQGKQVVLSTSSMDFLIRPLADHLDIADIIATECKYDDQDAFTGEVKGAFAFQEGKVMKTQAYLESKGLRFEDAAFFSDSFNDLPLLHKVKFPVPTNPDARLLKESRRRGWDTICFK